MYNDKLKWSKELADRIKKDFDPYAVIVGYTSGKDSNVSLKLATMFFDVDAAFTCNTTIAAIETLQNCERVAKEVYKLKYVSRMPPYGGLEENPDTYFELVKQHGFPGKTTTAHAWMYKYLKDHSVSKVVSSFRKRKHNRPIVIISGARKHESVRRMGTSEDVTIIGNNIWVNIANDWTDGEVYAFAKDNNLLELRSPISTTMAMSGECFCGCYARQGELVELKHFSPSTYQKILTIQKWLHENTKMKWDWESGPSKSWTLEKKGQMTLFSPQMLMCSTCMNNRSMEEDVNEFAA